MPLFKIAPVIIDKFYSFTKRSGNVHPNKYIPLLKHITAAMNDKQKMEILENLPVTFFTLGFYEFDIIEECFDFEKNNDLWKIISQKKKQEILNTLKDAGQYHIFKNMAPFFQFVMPEKKSWFLKLYGKKLINARTKKVKEYENILRKKKIGEKIVYYGEELKRIKSNKDSDFLEYKIIKEKLSGNSMKTDDYIQNAAMLYLAEPPLAKQISGNRYSGLNKLINQKISGTLSEKIKVKITEDIDYLKNNKIQFTSSSSRLSSFNMDNILRGLTPYLLFTKDYELLMWILNNTSEFIISGRGYDWQIFRDYVENNPNDKITERFLHKFIRIHDINLKEEMAIHLYSGFYSKAKTLDENDIQLIKNMWHSLNHTSNRFAIVLLILQKMLRIDKREVLDINYYLLTFQPEINDNIPEPWYAYHIQEFLNMTKDIWSKNVELKDNFNYILEVINKLNYPKLSTFSF
jgi:hypothetical protein